MLSLQLKSGEYITIGEDIVVQVFQVGQGFRVKIDAPKEVAIVRGEVKERTEDRPDSVQGRLNKSPSRRKRDAQRFQAARADRMK